jgi:hypothetical protein
LVPVGIHRRIGAGDMNRRLGALDEFGAHHLMARAVPAELVDRLHISDDGITVDDPRVSRIRVDVVGVGGGDAVGLLGVTIEGVTAAIVVILILLAVGIVSDSLLRLRKWLNKPPPGPDRGEPPDDGSD